MDKRVMWATAAVIFVASAVMGNFIVQGLRTPPEPNEETLSLIGAPLPPFSLKAIDGVVENASQWQGKVQIINFWATWCPPCKREIPILIELQDEYRAHGLQVIGIALDDIAPVKTYVEENGINYPILGGEQDVIEVAEQLGNNMGILPYTLVVDRAGNITFIRYGEVDKKTVESEIKALL